MVADDQSDTQVYADQLREEREFLMTQLERAQRKESTWSRRRQMLEDRLSRNVQELESTR